MTVEDIYLAIGIVLNIVCATQFLWCFCLVVSIYFIAKGFILLGCLLSLFYVINQEFIRDPLL